MKDVLVSIIGILVILLVFVVWPVIYFTAPCDKLDWMPARETPSRCLKIEVRP